MESWSRRGLLVLSLSLLIAAGCGNEVELIPLHGQVGGADPDDGSHLNPPDAFPEHDVTGDDDDDDVDGDDDDGDGDGDGDGDDGCTLTQGYWKNHENAWPVESLLLGSQAYSKDELLTLLQTSVSGDASLILAHQQIAALLNVANGASVPPEVAQALDSADQWMIANADADGRLSYGVHGGDAHGQASALATTLDDFNRGVIGPGHCHCR